MARDVNKYTREYRARTGNASTKRYEKTPRGFLMRLYRNMKSRVTGIQKRKAHLYLGKSILSKEEFYAWAKDSVEFLRLFRLWEQSKYDRRLCPSVNRINPALGYELHNMEWITHSQNSSLASVSRHDRNKEKAAVYDLLGVKREEK